MRRIGFATIIAMVALASTAFAQADTPVYRLVLPRGKGAVAIHYGDGWVLGQAHTLPDGQRSVMQTYNPDLDITESVSIFATLTPDPTGEACRQTIFTPSLEDITHRATVEDITRSTYRTRDGRVLPTASYLITKAGDKNIDQMSLSAYIGGAQLCSEMHLSKAHFKPSDLPAFYAEFDPLSARSKLRSHRGRLHARSGTPYHRSPPLRSFRTLLSERSQHSSTKCVQPGAKDAHRAACGRLCEGGRHRESSRGL